MEQKPITFPYKTVGKTPLLLDVYAPEQHGDNASSEGAHVVPALVYFHGGGLTVGNRKSWFPHWLKARVTSAGIAFISADYRLLPPSTGHDIVQDIKDIFKFIASDFNEVLLARLTEDPSGLFTGRIFKIDASRVAVAGTSAGGLCAYLAAIHARPQPKAVVALYAMGGNFMSPHYIMPKTTVFFRGREMLDPQAFKDYLPPDCHRLEVISDSPRAYYSADHPIPGYPANPRMLLTRLYLQLGTFLDFYTGMHSLSLELRQSLLSAPSLASSTGESDHHMAEPIAIPRQVIHLFPELCISPSWPPTFLIHGAEDTAVPVEESRHMQNLLANAGLSVTLRVIPGKEHSFDYAEDAETDFGQQGGLFDEVRDFVLDHLHPIEGRR